MAFLDKKITELEFISTPGANDRIAIVNLGVTKQTSVNKFLQSVVAATGSFIENATISGNVITFTRADGTTFNQTIVSASYADNANSSSYAVSSSAALRAVSSSFADAATSASYALSASYVESASYAVTSSYSLESLSASFAEFATSASYALTASYALNVPETSSFAVTASYVESASFSQQAVSSSYAATASFTERATSASNADTASRVGEDLTNGLGIEALIYNGSVAQQVQLDTASAHFTTGVSASQAATLTALSASLTATDQAISASNSALSASASTARNAIVSNISGAFDAVSASLTTTDQAISASVAALSASASTAREFYVLTSSISGLTQSFTLGNGTTYTNLLPDTGSVDLIFSMSNGLGIEAFTFDNTANASVQVDTSSAHFTVGVSASQAPTLTALSASLTATDQAISSSLATLSGSASDARNTLALQVSGAFDAVSASLTTTDQAISASVAALSASASTARDTAALQVSGAFDAVSASLTTTDQTISASVAALSSSAATALNNVSASAATDIVTNSASIAALSASSAIERLNFVQTSSVIGLGNVIEFTKGDSSTYTNTIITSSFVKSVNGILPSPNGNVSMAIAGVETGTSASLIAAAATADEGDVWVVSGESGSLTGSNGKAYIFNSTSSQWLEISNLDQPENDARYVLKFGDTMTGALILNADPVLPLGAATRQYVDALSGSASTARDTAALQVSGAFEAVSASFSTSQTALSASVSTDLTALSSSASTARVTLSASLTTTDQTISASVAALSASASTAREFYVLTSSISGLTQSFTLGNGTVYTNLLPDTGSVDLIFSMSNGLGVDTFTFDNTANASVQVNTASAHFTVGVSASQAPTLTALSASLTVTDQSISSSLALLSASAFVSASISSMTASFTKGDGSVSEIYIDTSSYALTASYLEGESNLTYRENVTGANTYTITHNLDEQFPIVQTYDTATNRMMLPDYVESLNVNQISIAYAVNFTGIVIVQK